MKIFHGYRARLLLLIALAGGMPLCRTFHRNGWLGVFAIPAAYCLLTMAVDLYQKKRSADIR